MEAKDRIIFPLDVPNFQTATEVMLTARNAGIRNFKVGLEAIHHGFGYQLAKTLVKDGKGVGYDAKLYDIPNTIKGSAAGIAELGVKWFNVMGCAGPEAISAAVENRGASEVYVVTVLTSMNEQVCQDTLGDTVEKKVLQYSTWALECGAQGVICSPRELPIVRAEPLLAKLKVITPGIRPDWAQTNDQKRVMVPGDAILAGADNVVIGRPISQPPAMVGFPEKAVQLIAAEIEEALDELAQKERK